MIVLLRKDTPIPANHKISVEIVCDNQEERVISRGKHKTNMQTGLTHTSQMEVTSELTASAVGSGDMEVLATPIMTALMENAAMKAVANALEAGQTTVGSMIETTHLHPTAVGDTVLATATLTEVDGRRLTFAISAKDSHGTIGEGTHVRYIVDRQCFLQRLKDANTK